ncbi:MAG: hypothetical protein ACXAB9_07885 [Candidatus Thorarchaeota archaeon]|jgi:hypothetical protein
MISTKYLGETHWFKNQLGILGLVSTHDADSSDKQTHICLNYNGIGIQDGGSYRSLWVTFIGKSQASA